MTTTSINKCENILTNDTSIKIGPEPNNLSVPYPSDIEVSGVSGKVTKVIVTLNNLTHSYAADVTVLLVAPDKTKYCLLMADCGGALGVANAILTFDQNATASLTDNQVLSGTYKPTNLPTHGADSNFAPPAPTMPWPLDLSVFNGIDPNGIWSLYIKDDANVDGGDLSGGWTLNLSTTTTGTITPPDPNPDPEPPPEGDYINVKDQGAKGDSVTNDTLAIQTSVDLCPLNGTVYVPDGTYMVNALAGINLKNDMTLLLSTGAVIKALPNNATNYSVININKKTNVTVKGGTIKGDRSEHTGVTGEYGMGISIISASNTTIEEVTCRDMWGDGFYIGGSVGDTLPTNIKIIKCAADSNRRNGISVVSADGVLIKDSVFKNTNGTAPEDGIDLEPNYNGYVKNVSIINCVCTENRGTDLCLHGGSQPEAFSKHLTNITVTGTVSNHGGRPNKWGTNERAVEVSNTHIANFTGNTFQNSWHGFDILPDSSDITAIGNIISQNDGNIYNKGVNCK
jgi:subtilisin-like proprotein convertase family protein